MDTIITLSNRLRPRELTNHSAQNVLDYLSSFGLPRNNFTFYTKKVLLSALFFPCYFSYAFHAL